MATQDKLITGLTNLMAAYDIPEHRKQEIINHSVNFASTLYWEGVDEGKRRSYDEGYSQGCIDTMYDNNSF